MNFDMGRWRTLEAVVWLGVEIVSQVLTNKVLSES